MKGIDLYRNPLESTGLTNFIHEICRTILIKLKNEIDLEPIGRNFTQIYGSKESAQRFVNILFNGNINSFLREKARG